LNVENQLNGRLFPIVDCSELVSKHSMWSQYTN